MQKYLSLSGHVYTPGFLVIGEDAWKKLTPDVQKTLVKIAWDMDDFARSEGERLDKGLLATLAPPMKINEVDKNAFMKASTPIYEEFGKDVPGGAELVKIIQSLK